MLDGVLALRRASGHGVPHLTKKLLAMICNGKEKTSFFNGGLLGIARTLQGRVHYQE